METIILAGGMGTRLQSVVSDVPKPMAVINGRPFLCRVLDWLSVEHVEHVVMAVKYKADCIVDFFGNKYKNIDIIYSFEEDLLGTGGAIKRALRYCKTDDIVVVNGDTLFSISIKKLKDGYNGIFTMACRYMDNAGRYGFVSITDGIVTNLNEKGVNSSGVVNGGVYIVNRKIFEAYPDKFSLETDVLPSLIESKSASAVLFNDYFIDIGIPKDYARAQNEL